MIHYFIEGENKENKKQEGGVGKLPVVSRYGEVGCSKIREKRPRWRVLSRLISGNADHLDNLSFEPIWFVIFTPSRMPRALYRIPPGLRETLLSRGLGMVLSPRRAIHHNSQAPTNYKAIHDMAPSG